MTIQQLTEGARRRGLWAMLAGTFLMWGGFFMVIPLIAVHYVDNLGWAAATIGLILAIRQVTQQGLTLLGGALADRLGARGLIAAGMLIRAISFVGLGWANTFPLLLVSVLLAALGGALFDSPSSAAIVALTREEDRARYYSLLGVISGLGMTIGPLIGALLLKVDFTFAALAAAACFFIAFWVILLLLPPVRVSSGAHGLLDGIGMALRDQRFMLFNLLLMGYWFMWVQITISLPLVARAISGTTDSVGWIYALNSVLGIVFQYPLLWLAERRLTTLPILILGVILMALALGSVAFIGNLTGLLICVALFAVGRLLASPTQQTVAASLSNPAALGSYFGVNALALALGGGLGNFSGGLLYELSGELDLPALPWLIFCAVGLGAAMGLALLHKSETRSQSVLVTRNS